MIQPFEQLSVSDQQVAIDLTVCASMIVTRLPGISELVFDAIAKEFATQYDLPTATAKYALRALGRTLYETSWVCTITKDHENNVSTHFKLNESVPGGNGD